MSEERKNATWSTAWNMAAFLQVALGNGSLLDLDMQQVNAEHFTYY